ncbi:hypothetical protein [Gordonia zhaorongruii]|uniref:hypothetical protein n=1 Tax=Gordonia zhaorongruii TaxID=2597659 RepID=UPI0010478200|nr:hypothetical protein [Gordonia zhaorongruii]
MNALLRVCAALLIAVVGAFALTACGGEEEPDRPGVDLPAGFPTDDVPLIDGAVMAGSGDDKGWRVTIQASAADGNALENAVKKLVDSGFEESSRAGDNAQRTVLLTKNSDPSTYWVNIGISADAAAGGSSIFYNVTRTN